MSTLTKGQLVMTEHGLAWYEDTVMTTCRTTPIESDGAEYALSDKVSPATREQVEQYLKEKGWEFPKHHTAYKKEQQWTLFELADGSWSMELKPSCLQASHFDTAPAQLAEAILCAKLLNATKD